MTPVTTTALDRSDILEMMGSLKLFGMRSAFDAVISTAVKRQHEPQRLVGTCSKPRSTRSMPALSGIN